MPVTIRKANGGIVTYIIVQKVSVSYTNRTSITDLPTASYDIVQDMGNKSSRISLQGLFFLTGSSGIVSAAANSILYSLPGTTGSILYTGLGGCELYSKTVQFMSISFEDSDRPFERKFTLNSIELS
jgi:hypothetical protein